MAYRILILGASYGSMLATKCAMAGHDVTLVCRRQTAELINREGTEVRILLKGEDKHRAIRSTTLPGRIDASVPEQVEIDRYDLVVLAMQEPQYLAHAMRTLMVRIALAGIPCLSLMNMPPLAYLKRIPSIDAAAIEGAYTDPRLWDRFQPGKVTLCSPDPQAVRPEGEPANVLHVGLATNFKAARFEDPADTAILRKLEADIDAVRLDGLDVPVKLRLHDSLFVPLAKWSMLMAGNYRCVLAGGGLRPIREAVHGDIALSRAVYDHTCAIVQRMGGQASDLVPFEKYAAAAQSLLKPSSVARAIAAGTPFVERVDRLVDAVSRSLGMPHAEISQTVNVLDRALAANRVAAA